jgi:hypothetical protein
MLHSWRIGFSGDRMMRRTAFCAVVVAGMASILLSHNSSAELRKTTPRMRMAAARSCSDEISVLRMRVQAITGDSQRVANAQEAMVRSDSSQRARRIAETRKSLDDLKESSRRLHSNGQTLLTACNGRIDEKILQSLRAVHGEMRVAQNSLTKTNALFRAGSTGPPSANVKRVHHFDLCWAKYGPPDHCGPQDLTACTDCCLKQPQSAPGEPSCESGCQNRQSDCMLPYMQNIIKPCNYTGDCSLSVSPPKCDSVACQSCCDKMCSVSVMCDLSCALESWQCLVKTMIDNKSDTNKKQTATDR